ncbi:MAG: helix-turn-helix transcriptional regulator [Clostridiales bacterium]|nr:helix-turn-helix transcriptional regulator [Clostridiales bacterium]
MDYSRYENFDFDRISAFNMSTGFKDRSYQMHWHSYGEILLVGPGETNIFKVNQSTYNLKEGDFVLAWPMEMHAILDADREQSLVIQFSNAFMNSLLDLQRIMHFYRNLHVIERSAHPHLSARLQTLVYKMRDVFFSETSDRELRCCMLLMEFILAMDEHRDEFTSELNPGGRGNYTDDVMRRMLMVTDYIKNNLTSDDLSQQSMADMAGISKDYFSRIFKNVTGMNYSKWLNMIRLEKATELLSQNDMTLTQVAMLSGFRSIPSFNRVFYEEKGMAPGEYRSLFVSGENSNQKTK